MLQIFISNNIRIRGLTTRLRAAITAKLTMPNPAYENLKRMGKPTYGIDRELQQYVYDSDGSLVCPRGFEKELLDMLPEAGVTSCDVQYGFNEPHPVDVGPWKGFLLRDYQQPAVAAAAKDGGVLVAPAGSGKTLMGCAVMLAWQTPTLWLTHTLDLLDQSARAAEAMLGGVGTVGRIGDGKIEWGSGKLIVATVQTLQKNEKLVELLTAWAGAVIVDEAHHFPAQQFIEVVGRFNAKRILGLTATPDRKDGLERLMYLGLGPKCHEVSRDGMYDAGAIILPEVRFVYTDFGAVDQGRYDELVDYEPEGANVDAGGEDLDYSALMKELYEDQPRAKLVAEKVLESCLEVSPKGGSVIVLAQGIRYLFTIRDLVERFAKTSLGFAPRMQVIHGGISQYTWRKVTKAKYLAAQKDVSKIQASREARGGGYEIRFEQYTDAEMQDWQVTPAQRKAVIEDAKARKVDILFATGQLVKEGLDIPNLYHGHLITPQRGDRPGSRNGAGVEQAIGRIMRADPANPDKKARWYDYVDNNIGVFNDQYYSRRSVYKRLGIAVPVKKRAKKNQEVIDFLNMGGPFGGLPL